MSSDSDSDNDEPTLKRQRVEPSSVGPLVNWALQSTEQREEKLKKADTIGPHSPALSKIIAYGLEGSGLPTYPFASLIAEFLGVLCIQWRWKSFEIWWTARQLANPEKQLDVGVERLAALRNEQQDAVHSIVYPNVPMHRKVEGGIGYRSASQQVNPWSYATGGRKEWPELIATDNDGDRGEIAHGHMHLFVYKAEQRLLAAARRGDTSEGHMERAYNHCKMCSASGLPQIAELRLGHLHCRTRTWEVRPELKMTDQLLRYFCKQCRPMWYIETPRYRVRVDENWCFGRTEVYAEAVLYAIEQQRAGKAYKPKARKRTAAVAAAAASSSSSSAMSDG